MSDGISAWADEMAAQAYTKRLEELRSLNEDELLNQFDVLRRSVKHLRNESLTRGGWQSLTTIETIVDKLP